MTLIPDNARREKYQLTAPHVEVAAVAARINGGKALDIGCGDGRNSLYLHGQGFAVTAWDNSPAHLARLNNIIAQEKLSAIHTARQDFNTLRFNGAWDLVISIGGMMFLQPQTIPQLIADMQACTVRDGYNLIVAAMDSSDASCPVDFPFSFTSGELSHYYRRWHIVTYHEHPALWQSGDQAGPASLRFATLLARKASIKA